MLPKSTTVKGPYKNDFYAMFSPSRGTPEFIKAFAGWTLQPGIYNLSALDKGFQPQSTPYLDLNKMGLHKISYKSYHDIGERGLFYWIMRGHDELKEKLIYGDINAQGVFPTSITPFNKCALIHIDNDKTPDVSDLPPEVTQAYVMDKKLKTYFVDKVKGTSNCVSVNDALYFTGIFKNYSADIKYANNYHLFRILLLSTDKINHPARLCNIEGSTLLHHAVMINDTDIVNLLLDAGVRLDLKATYREYPSNEIRTFTPLELAKFLRYDGISSLLANKFSKESNEKAHDTLSVPSSPHKFG